MTDAVALTAGAVYEASVSDPAFRMIVRETVNDKVSTFYLTNEDRFTAKESATYCIAVHNVYSNHKNLDFEKYVELFQNGMSFALTDVTEISKAEVTEVKANFSIDQGQDYVWVSGTYAQGNAKEGATYYVTTQNIWGNYKDLNFQKYVELMDAGLKFDIVIVE